MYKTNPLNPDYLRPKIKEMISIDSTVCKNLARMVIEEISDADYYNGTIDYEDGEYHYKLRVTLLVYRENAGDPSDSQASRIKDILPVWWELASEKEGKPVLNDFSWLEFRDYIL